MFSSTLGPTPNQTTSPKGNQSLLCHRVTSYDCSCKCSAGIQQKHLQIERRGKNCFHWVLFIDSLKFLQTNSTVCFLFCLWTVTLAFAFSLCYEIQLYPEQRGQLWRANKTRDPSKLLSPPSVSFHSSWIPLIQMRKIEDSSSSCTFILENKHTKRETWRSPASTQWSFKSSSL